MIDQLIDVGDCMELWYGHTGENGVKMLIFYTGADVDEDNGVVRSGEVVITIGDEEIVMKLSEVAYLADILKHHVIQAHEELHDVREQIIFQSMINKKGEDNKMYR